MGMVMSLNLGRPTLNYLFARIIFGMNIKSHKTLAAKGGLENHHKTSIE